MARIVWTEQSAQDLEHIAEYIALGSVKYAKLTVRKIRTSANVLKQQPLTGRIVPEINSNEIRELIIGNYRLIYQVQGTQVTILTVHHSARLLKADTFLPET